MIVFPPCKINLGLFVTGKRADGFHDIESLFLPVPLTDVLEVIEAPKGVVEFEVSGLGIDGRKEENICVKAWQLLARDFDLPGIRSHLHKIIPTGAGLGGGSSDGAAMIRILNTVFSLGLSAENEWKYAAELGSDCPFFIDPAPAFVSGRGEKIEPISIDLSGIYICIVHPGVNMSTAEAYQMVRPSAAPVDLRATSSLPRSQWKEMLRNDFEEPVSALHPAIAEIRQSFYDRGAFYASMSGSGSAVYGLFDQPVKVDFPGWFVWGGWLSGTGMN